MKKETRQEDDYMEIDLLKLAGALWRRAWAILLAMVLFGGAAFSYAYFLVTPLYQSSALMYVNNSSFSVGSTAISLADLNASKSLVDTYLVIMKTRMTLNEVIEQARLSYSYEELREMIDAASVNGTEVFSITVTSPDPQEAEKIANTIVEILPRKIEQVMDGSSVRAVDYAVVPDRKSSPSITRYTAIGLALGFVVSCAVIVLIELLDEQIRSEDQLTQAYEFPLLASIPDLMSAKTRAGYGGYYAAAAGKGKK